MKQRIGAIKITYMENLTSSWSGDCVWCVQSDFNENIPSESHMGSSMKHSNATVYSCTLAWHGNV